MIRIRSTALPAAVTVLLFVGACQDAPSSPRSRAEPAVVPAPDAQPSDVRTYSGRRADSVATAILATWARHGHPEYLAQRAASRKNLHLAPAAAARLVPASAPARVLDGDGSTGTYKDPPRIINHDEGFYFGSSSGGRSIQTLLNTSMSFVGDRGRIFANVTITGPGATIAQSETLADGAGDPLSCADIVFGNCGGSKFLEGAMVFGNAPYCDAHATGSATYTAQNTDLSLGSLVPLSPSGGSYSGLPATAVASINSNSPACSTQDNNGGTGVGTAGDGGDAPPLYPDPQPAPPAYPTAPVSFTCETVQWYYFGVLETEYQVCYAN